MADNRVVPDYPASHQSSGDPLQPQPLRAAVTASEPDTMDSRDHSEIPPAHSYPSPNAAQIGQATMSYYANQSRHLTADELHLSAELSREASTANMNDGSANGIGHGQPMVLGQSNSGSTDINRATQDDQHQQQQQQQQQQQPPPQHQQQQQQQQQSHLIQFTPNQQVGVDPNHDLSYGDQSARRKRSKVSRACDECRRKKVRCDATSEAGVETCTNCRRTNATCEFSRVPMKRGPSKGYIKELADRINSLENQMHPGIPQSDMQYQPMQEDTSPRGYQEFSSPVEGNLIPRKRTYSMSEGLQNTFVQSQFSHNGRPTSVGGWPVQTPSKDQSQGHQGDGGAGVDMYSNTLTNGSARVNQPFWSQEGITSGHQSDINSLGDELQPPIELDEKVFDAYYNHIHLILPVLPNSRDRFRDHLQQCNRQIQEVFLYCLYAVTGANMFRAGNQFQQIPTFEKAQDRLYASFREEPSSRSLPTNFVLLQSILLMVLEADTRGPENLLGQNGLSKSVLLEVAYPLSYHIAKNLGQVRTSNPDDTEPDSDANIARRNWIVVGILSRWHAVAVAGPDIFDTNETATLEDQQIFGAVPLQISRYSTLLTEIHDLLFDITPYTLSNYGASRALKRNMYGQLSRIRDVEQLHLDDNTDNMNAARMEELSPLMFWFITLLLKRHLFTYTPSEILYPAEVIIDLLHKQSQAQTSETAAATTQILTTHSTPFHLHFFSLAVLTLLEITDLPDLANDAWESLEKALQIISHREKYSATAGEFENLFSTPRWDACIHGFIQAKLAKGRPQQSGPQVGATSDSGGAAGPGSAAPPIVGPTEQRSLQHLADLAVGAGSAGGSGNAPSPPGTSAGNGPGEEKEANTRTAAGPSEMADGLQQQPSSVEPQRPAVFIDFTRLTKKGYLNVLAANFS
ncbi:C6 finger domain-containing protein [Histoplasma capsulatum var. duboisii H88]|uniref:C6 finger domain-containing protein n=1 Tax=Ajellomyces capsulatus (strain H88) TaxID=544711 RepID=F0UTM3_AJEC8|nr:C6 finger domain-containing protein [Histoplasma capsulatum var. duboisii H88]QSS57920.1 C6 finger domain-containing protein [Histoplasma capsulatum var. duboisii H88]